MKFKTHIAANEANGYSMYACGQTTYQQAISPAVTLEEFANVPSEDRCKRCAAIAAKTAAPTLTVDVAKSGEGFAVGHVYDDGAVKVISVRGDGLVYEHGMYTDDGVLFGGNGPVSTFENADEVLSFCGAKLSVQLVKLAPTHS